MPRIISARSAGSISCAAAMSSRVGPEGGSGAGWGFGIDPRREACDAPAQHWQPFGAFRRIGLQGPPTCERAVTIALLERGKAEIEPGAGLTWVDPEGGGKRPFGFRRDPAATRRRKRLAVERPEPGVGRKQFGRAAIGARRLRMPFERRKGPAQQAPAPGVVGPFLHPLREPPDQRRHVRVVLGGACFGALRFRDSGHDRCAPPEIEPAGGKRQHRGKDHGEYRSCLRRVAALRAFLPRGIGGEQPAADLRARGFELAFGNQTAGAIAFQLGELVAVDLDIVFRARSRRRPGSQQGDQDAENDRQRHRGEDREQDHGVPSPVEQTREPRPVPVAQRRYVVGKGGAAAAQERRDRRRSDQQDRRRAEPERIGLRLERRRQEHEVAVAFRDEPDDLAVARARGQAFANDKAQIPCERSIGIVDRLVLADQAAELFGDRPRPVFQPGIGQDLVGLDRGNRRGKGRYQHGQQGGAADHPPSSFRSGTILDSRSRARIGPTCL